MFVVLRITRQRLAELVGELCLQMMHSLTLRTGVRTADKPVGMLVVRLAVRLVVRIL